ncbi:MAG: hypothetical protein WB611_30490 [Stellaceae bacterium]
MFSGQFFRQGTGHRARALSVLAGTLFGILALAASGAAFAQCTGPGAPGKGSPWTCLTAIQVPGQPITSFDISWVNPNRAEYYLADRSNKAIDIVDTRTNKFKTQITGFVGGVVNPNTNTFITAQSGPDGVVSFGKWLYAGDGNSTLKVIDLDKGSIVQSVPTGGQFRVDEMALTGIMSNGQQLLLAANNADDPPFATLFQVNGNNFNNYINIRTRITVDPSLIPPGMGLSLEQPSWDPTSKRFYVSIPQINYPAGCTIGAVDNPGKGIVGCQGGLLVIDPSGVSAPNCTAVSGIPSIGSVCQYTYGAYDRTHNIGVLALPTCAPNGSTVGPTPDGIGHNLLLGCTPANNAGVKGTLAINTNTTNFATIGNITGSDEVWYNSGDGHYYTGSSANLAQFGGPVLGIIDAFSNILVSTIPQGSGSHSVAADSIRNTIYVPQVVPQNASNTMEPGAGGGDTTGVSKQTCGSNNGCIVVYKFLPPPPPPITD